MCAASQESSSFLNPEIRFTTPAGTSEVAKISPIVMPGRGCDSETTATTVLPPTRAGAMRAVSPSSEGVSGASTPTTPVGSGRVKL